MKCRLKQCKAACCHNIPFVNNELEKYADKIVTPVLFTVPIKSKDGKDAVVAFTTKDVTDLGNNKCPFLRNDYKCNIYENRPEICRLYGQIEELYCKFRKK